MRINFTRVVCLLLLFGVVGGCDLAKVGDAIIVSDVEDEFYIDMWESLSSANGDRSLILKIESIEPEACLNYSIDYQFERDGSRLLVSLNDIIEPTDCQAGEAPVKADIDIGGLPSSSYIMNIDFRNTVENTGQLLVSSESYFLTMKSENGIVLLRKELLRVPDNMVWGYVALQPGVDAGIREAFFTDLRAISKTPQGVREGYYGHFTVLSTNGDVFVHEQPTDGTAKTFLLEYTGTQANLKSLLANYRESYENQLIIKLFNSKGETF